MNTRTRFLTAATGLAAAFLTIGMGASTAHAAATGLTVVANGCDFTFTTVGGEGAADGWTAGFSVDGNDAGTWGSSNDVEVLTNFISRDFTPGGTLSITWTLYALPGTTVLASGTTVLVVPQCDMPYRIQIHKVVTGQPPAAGFTVNVWSADGDHGLDCTPQPPNATQTVVLPAAGGDMYVRATPGHWCVQEVERRGALTTTYSSTGGSMLGEAHVVTVAPAPGTTMVTITNTFELVAGGAPTLVSAGSSTTLLAVLAGVLLALGLLIRRFALPATR